MDDAAITQYITSTFPDIQMLVADGNTFYYYGPDQKVPEKTMPFATLITGDDYDTASQLSRLGVYRLNIGVSKATYQELLGDLPAAPGDSGIVATGHDFTTLDQIMPHPIYGHLGWISVLNPSPVTFATVEKLLAEAYQSAVHKQAKRKPDLES